MNYCKSSSFGKRRQNCTSFPFVIAGKGSENNLMKWWKWFTIVSFQIWDWINALCKDTTVQQLSFFTDLIPSSFKPDNSPLHLVPPQDTHWSQCQRPGFHHLHCCWNCQVDQEATTLPVIETYKPGQGIFTIGEVTLKKDPCNFGFTSRSPESKTHNTVSGRVGTFTVR